MVVLVETLDGYAARDQGAWQTLSAAAAVVVPLKCRLNSAACPLYECLWNPLTQVAVCGVLSVAAIVPVLLAGAYWHYRGTGTTAILIYLGAGWRARVRVGPGRRGMAKWKQGRRPVKLFDRLMYTSAHGI